MAASTLNVRMDHAIQILSKTSDGDDLAPQHLKLLENVVNDRASNDGLKAFDDLFAQVSSGTYGAPWFHGRMNLTQRHDGYVYWRGRQVEHYSFRDRAAEAVAANQLADQCLQFEQLGFVPGQTPSPDRILSLASNEATLAWAHAFAKVPAYSLLERGGVVDGVRQAVILFWTPTGQEETPRILCGVSADSKNKVEVMVDPIWSRRQDHHFGLDLFYRLQAEGYGGVNAAHNDQALFMDSTKLLAWVDEFGFTPTGLLAVAEHSAEYVAKLVEKEDADRGVERSRG